MLLRSRRWIAGGVILVVLIISVRIFLHSIYRLPILMYHSINYSSNAKDKIVITPELFEKQMKYLHNNGYNVVSLEKAVSYIVERKTPPAKTVAITFDDGYEDNYKYAYPVLKKYNIQATIFVIVDKVGDEGFLSWDQIKEMSDSGLIDVESHTRSHVFLQYDISDADLKYELKSSKDILEKKLGKKIKYICYPMGGYNARAKGSAKKYGYGAAFATKPAKGAPDYDLYELKRVRISSSANNPFVLAIKVSGYHSFLRTFNDDNKSSPEVVCVKKEYLS